MRRNSTLVRPDVFLAWDQWRGERRVVARDTLPISFLAHRRECRIRYRACRELGSLQSFRSIGKRTFRAKLQRTYADGLQKRRHTSRTLRDKLTLARIGEAEQGSKSDFVRS